MQTLGIPTCSRFLIALFLFAAAPAFASDPAAIYVHPERVEFFPNEANATKVVIHGAFFFWMNGGSYSDPKCGYMYFTCPQGQEAMCRMQWSEINAAIGGGGQCANLKPCCTGVGALNMMTTATLRAEGTPLGLPDTYDMGMGVAIGTFVYGKCAPAQALQCGQTKVGDGGMPATVDMSMPAPPADLSMQPNPADLATPSKPDLAQPPLGGHNASCAIGMNRGAHRSFLGLAGLLLALVLRRRRRV